MHTEAYREDVPGVLAALDDLKGSFSDSLIDKALLKRALQKMEARFTAETRKHERNVCWSFPHDILRTLNHNVQLESVLAVATRPTTHVRSLPPLECG